MIHVTGLYRDMPDSKFDFNYFVNTHMPLAKKLLSDFGMGKFEVERGIEAADGEAAPFICITHVEFPTIEDFRRGLERHGEELFADVPNYTNIEPEIQFSEIVNSRD
jgi:uncharacterized protein (TIGR02118 family)